MYLTRSQDILMTEDSFRRIGIEAKNIGENAEAAIWAALWHELRLAPRLTGTWWRGADMRIEMASDTMDEFVKNAQSHGFSGLWKSPSTEPRRLSKSPPVRVDGGTCKGTGMEATDVTD